jgi:hypothetical protein
MTTLSNPTGEIKILADIEFTITDSYFDFEVIKDLDEEPNECELTVYNLAESTRQKLTTAASAINTVQFSVTPFGQTERVLAFEGEIDAVTHRNLRPGHETHIKVLSQKIHHVSAFVEEKTYAEGTYVDVIVDDFIKVLKVPIGHIDTLPDSKILLSQSYSGQALPLLKSFIADMGMYCYMLDGKIYITSVYQPESPNVKTIDKRFVLAPPERVSRNDAYDVELRTLVEYSVENPSAKKRRQKKVKDVTTEYETISAVDKEIMGYMFTLFLCPTINPNDVIEFPDYPDLKAKQHVVKSLRHYGSINYNGGEFTTELDTDDYAEESF